MPLGYILTFNDVMTYYTERPDIQRALIQHGHRRRTISGLDTGMFGKRGSPMSRPEQVVEMLKPLLEKQLSNVPRKYPSFHASVSRFAQDDRAVREGGFLGIGGTAPAHDPTGQGEAAAVDFIMDIDIKTDHKAAWAQGRKVVELYESFGLPYRVKFSGNSSPHILLPGDLFPPGTTGDRYSQTSRKLMEFIDRKAKPTNVDGSFNSPDHYLRMPYSLNENTGLVSIPIAPGGYDDFRVEMAEAQNVVVVDDWIDVTNADRTGMDNFLDAAGVRR